MLQKMYGDKMKITTYNSSLIDATNNHNATVISQAQESTNLTMPLVIIVILFTGFFCCFLRPRFYIQWKYSWILKRCRRERQRLRENGHDVGSNQLFEQALFLTVFREVPFDSIDMITGRSVATVQDMHNRLLIQNAVNYLLDNWRTCEVMPSDTDNDTTCSICLNKMTPINSIVHPHINHSESGNVHTEDVHDQLSDSEPVQIPCGHIFHEKCIRNWAISHNNCPVCRFEPKSHNSALKKQITENSDVVTATTPPYNITNLGVYQPVSTDHSSNQPQIAQVVPSHNTAVEAESGTNVV